MKKKYKTIKLRKPTIIAAVAALLLLIYCNNRSEVITDIQQQEDQSLSLSNVVLIEKERNVLFRYDNQIKFNPEKENLLWGVTSKGELAYFRQFDSLDINSSRQTLKMNILS